MEKLAYGNKNNEFGDRTKRVAKNSFVLFARIFFITIINLFSVRYILKGLGEIDYGIYNAVAGVVLASSFIVPVLSLSIQRFYNYSIGQKDYDRLKVIFSVSVNIIIVLSLVVVLLMESIGVWFVDAKMTIPPERIADAHIVFQFAIFAFVFSLLQIPYTAAIFANEDMGIYALVSSLDCVLKFVVALLIFCTSSNMVFYGLALCVVAFVVFCFYAIISHVRYDLCRYSLVKEKEPYRELLSFSGWSLYGAVAATGLLQGSNILLNLFFGPIFNAAYAVGMNVYNAFNSLNNSIILSFRPAMIQSYAEKEFSNLNRLFMLSNKALYYLLLAVSLPIIFEMRFLLQLWLGKAPEITVAFCRLFIVYGVFLAMHNPVTTIVQATGKMRLYSLSVESITIMNIPLAYLSLKCGATAEGVFYSMIGLCLLAQCVRVICLKHVYKEFSSLDYVWRFVLPAILVSVLAVLLTYSIRLALPDGIIGFVSVCILSPLVTLALTFVLGIGRTEQKSLINFICNKIGK